MQFPKVPFLCLTATATQKVSTLITSYHINLSIQLHLSIFLSDELKLSVFSLILFHALELHDSRLSFLLSFHRIRALR